MQGICFRLVTAQIVITANARLRLWSYVLLIANRKHLPSIHSLISRLRKMVYHWFRSIEDMIRRLTTEIKECKQKKMCIREMRLHVYCVVFEKFTLNPSIYWMSLVNALPRCITFVANLLWLRFAHTHAHAQSTLSLSTLPAVLSAEQSNWHSF